MGDTETQPVVIVRGGQKKPGVMNNMNIEAALNYCESDDVPESFVNTDDEDSERVIERTAITISPSKKDGDSYRPEFVLIEHLKDLVQKSRNGGFRIAKSVIYLVIYNYMFEFTII
jgi:hypothetical protein